MVVKLVVMPKCTSCFLALFFFLFSGSAWAQVTGAIDFQLAVYDDNDFLNVLGPATDRAYTNGTGIDLFYNNQRSPSFFLDKWLPRLSPNSINNYSYSIKQVMITPADLSSAFYQKNDYPYSGGLYATHTLYSYDSIRKADLQTSVVAGVMGPLSLTRQTQVTVHSFMDYSLPLGWNNQLNNDVLLNVNMTAEKKLLHWRQWMEMVASGNACLGTMLDQAGAFATLYMGKMSPYFYGNIKGRSCKKGDPQHWQLYFSFSAGTSYVLYNSIYQGGLFSSQPMVPVEKITEVNHLPYLTISYVMAPEMAVKPWQNRASFSVYIVLGRYCISYTQIKTSPVLKGLYSDLYGNMTISRTW